MPSTQFDAVIIGTGQAGPTLAARLAGSGRKVAIVERGSFGGTCVNNGCTPTKALVASAYVARLAERAHEYGVGIGARPQIDMARVKARKDAIVAASSSSIEQWLASLPNATLYRGHASFVGPRTIRVGEQTLHGDQVFVNVGGRPLVPDLPGLDRVRYFTNETMMHVDFLPEHLVIVGGSYIGLEFGQMYRRFGSRVTIVEMAPRLIAREDRDVSEAVQAFLAAEGIELRTGAKCIALAPAEGDRIVMDVDCRSGAPKVSGTHLLLAVGRVPNTDGLGLDKAGIEVDGRGYIKVDEALRTSAPSVFALGDCNGRGAFTHTSYNDHEIVADNLLNGAQRKVSDRLPAYALFTDPPLGRAGMTEDEARRAAPEVLVGRRPMTRVARAIERGETVGFLKLLVDARSKRILGAAMLGVGADEVVHSVLDAMYAQLPYTMVQRGVRIHPTVSELIPTVLGELEPLSGETTGDR